MQIDHAAFDQMMDRHWGVVYGEAARGAALVPRLEFDDLLQAIRIRLWLRRRFLFSAHNPRGAIKHHARTAVTREIDKHCHRERFVPLTVGRFQ